METATTVELRAAHLLRQGWSDERVEETTGLPLMSILRLRALAAADTRPPPPSS